MNNYIYYYSGTGNSFYLASKLANKLNIEAKSINECDKFDYEDDCFGLFIPSLYGRLNKSVIDFLRKLSFNNTYIYVIITAKDGKCLKMINDIIKDSNGKINYAKYIECPENDIISFFKKTKKDDKNKKILDKALKEVLDIYDDIKNKRNNDYKDNNVLKKYKKLSDKEFYERIANYGDYFMFNDNCIRCKICELTCESQNITLAEGFPMWKNHCDGCLRCINMCPYNAIEFEGYTSGKRRYKNPYVDIDEFGIYLKEEGNENGKN